MLLNLRLRTLCTGLNCVGASLPCHLGLQLVSETPGSVPNTKHACSELHNADHSVLCYTSCGEAQLC